VKSLREPGHRHPAQGRIGPPPPGVDLQRVAEKAVFKGSQEHHRRPGPLGPPRLRVDATPCDPELEGQTELLTGWLRQAIRAGLTSELWENGFPRYVWHKVGGKVYQARHLRSPPGEYKGWRLAADQWPRELA